MADAGVNPMETYQKDPRIACQYGAKCYQKNPVHHQKYKHPPVKTQKPAAKGPTKPKKRKLPTKAVLPKPKIRKDEAPAPEASPEKSPSPSLSSGDEEDSSNDSEKDFSSSLSSSDEEKGRESPEKKTPESGKSPEVDKKSEQIEKSPEVKKYKNSVPDDQKKLIKQLFLVEMPDDFYEFYEFCCSLSPGAPASALRAVGLELVGPFDVLLGKIDESSQEDDKFLRHWRYFYDPPEFQTILKGNNKEGLHFGYWRDEDDKLPVFVAKNSAMVDCKIVPVAETLFGAISAYTEERLKKASPFETSSISLLSRKVKQFAKTNKISLELDSLSMKSRNRKSVAKTFHGAGIVVPYDKTTQIGYRTLAATDSQFKKILEKLEDEDDDVKKEHMSKIDEMVRLATIAADECDFGTPLELAHDLFSSGLPSLQPRALQMFIMSYSLLQRPIFSRIAQAHLKDRKKECDLSVI